MTLRECRSQVRGTSTEGSLFKRVPSCRAELGVEFAASLSGSAASCAARSARYAAGVAGGATAGDSAAFAGVRRWCRCAALRTPFPSWRRRGKRRSPSSALGATTRTQPSPLPSSSGSGTNISTGACIGWFFNRSRKTTWAKKGVVFSFKPLQPEKA